MWTLCGVAIVIMGKTDAGKSTLVNTILGEKVAEVGMGGRQTEKNELYSRKFGNIEINVYDTVGLEINEDLNRQTLDGIKQRIEQANNEADSDDINIVWYCINPNTHKFEPYEEKLINMLIYEYEVPFVIVLTRAFSKKNAKLMTEYISKEYPGHCVFPILAEDFETDAGIIKAYGVPELLDLSIEKYDSLKEGVFVKKQEIADQIIAEYEENIQQDLSEKIRIAKRTIKDAGTAAAAMGWVPGVSLVAFQIPLISAFNSIAHTFGISLDTDAVGTIVGDCMAAVVASPLLGIPGLSSYLAKSLVIDECNEFLESVLEVINYSEPNEIRNARLMSQRISENLTRRKRG